MIYTTTLNHFMIVVLLGLTIPVLIRFIRFFRLVHPIRRIKSRNPHEIYKEPDPIIFGRLALAAKCSIDSPNHSTNQVIPLDRQTAFIAVAKEAAFLDSCRNCETSIRKTRRDFHLSLWVSALSIAEGFAFVHEHVNHSNNSPVVVMYATTAFSLFGLLGTELPFCLVMWAAYRYMDDILAERRGFWILYCRSRMQLVGSDEFRQPFPHES